MIKVVYIDYCVLGIQSGEGKPCQETVPGPGFTLGYFKLLSRHQVKNQIQFSVMAFFSFVALLIHVIHKIS